MLLAALALALNQSATIERDAFGVPQIKAATVEEAFLHSGYAVAEDRLWQMENSRRLARGSMAAVFGKAMADSDREVLRTGYTDEELQAQLDKLSPPVRTAFREYTRGVNAYIQEASKAGKLPKGYAENAFEPEPWTELDSAAITIRLFQLFGRGGAGEARNLALLTYLQSQPVKDRALDVIDDLLWFDDPRSPTTVRPEDSSGAEYGKAFPLPTRAQTQSHLAGLPKFTLFDLMPGLRLLDHTESDMLALSRAVPFKTGSYAVVVGRERSSTGRPLLLGAPQMGFTDPSIVHEISISAPGFAAAGMDIPGVPGVAIGHGRRVAWTLTSGVMDTDDLFCFKDEGSSYLFGKDRRPFQLIVRPLKVKGEPDIRVEQKRTHWGPVVVSSSGAQAVLARRSSYWMRELESCEAVFRFAGAESAEDMEKAADRATMSFNLFYATSAGDIGYRFLGLSPRRKAGLDPRFPAMASPENDWDGFLAAAQMPAIRNPKSGLITNWNNKPAPGWPNSDTPAWGRTFRVEALNRALLDGKLGMSDLERAAWQIARTEFTTPHLMVPFQTLQVRSDLTAIEADAWSYLAGFDGWSLEGSVGASLYFQTLIALREELFLRHVGTMLAPETFRQAIQPSLILNALDGKTKFDYLAGRKLADVVLAAFRKAVERLAARGDDPALWGYRPGAILYSGEAPVPYSDRGTYIQLVEARPEVRGRNVLPPGTSEAGAHRRDQVALARAWQFKPMRIR